MRFRLLGFLGLFLPAVAPAQPSLEEVFRSTHQNFQQPGDTGTMMAWVCAAAAMVILVLILLNRRQRRQATPRALNHPGKLIREMQKQANLKPAEIRQLKALADGAGVSNPLTLLLCPSLLAKAARARPERVDRPLVNAMIKRLG